MPPADRSWAWCWAAIALAFFAIEGMAEPCCRPEAPGEPERTLHVDLDGDGILDTLDSVSDSGSGMSTTEVELALSRTGLRIEVDAEFSFTTMLNATAVPPELLAPGMERALEAVESALFGCVCENPDPSLAWLLEKGPRSLRWVAGTPSLPDAYTLRRAGEWLSYSGHTHRGLMRASKEPEIERLATDPRTGYVLARTAHGVLLIDEKGGRYAWLYVTLDGGGQKLRFPTVVGGRLEEDRAVIRLSHAQAYYGTYGCGLLRIDLRDGSFTERWRDLDSPGAAMEPCWAELERNMNETASQTCCPVVELRQYSLHPGKRDILIDLFDREFVESQEALGMRVIGQFRDLEAPDRFTWLRGFRDMPSRAQALQDFYGGPVWKAHREAANATMIDSDNVLLLRPASAESGFSLETSNRPPLGAHRVPEGLVVATIYYFEAPAGEDFVGFFEQALKPLLINAGASILGYFVTESSANSFPALPVREGENVFVWFSHFQDQAAYDGYVAALARSPHWGGEIAGELARRLKSPPEVLKLSPTGRSQLR